MEENILQDRVGEYLIPHLKEFIFDELSESYLEKAGLKDVLLGVPVPVRKTDMVDLTTLKIAQNMAFVIGCDINFKYRDNYIEYITRMFTKEFVKPLVNEGIEGAAQNDFDYACICFRGALLIDPESTDALYCYGRACKDTYELGQDEEFIGRFKAESLDAFEKLSIKAPDFDMGFYFLGYGYLNLGLYIKAKLAWEKFLELSENEDMKKEVMEWMAKLEEPVKIEEGYNFVLSARYQQGIDALAPYTKDNRFNNWWPLWYYLGIAYKEMGQIEEAEEHFLRVLKLSPSNTDTMAELVEIYKAVGNEEKLQKYEEKIKIIKDNHLEDLALKKEMAGKNQPLS